MAYKEVSIYVSQPSKDMPESAVSNQLREIRDAYLKQGEDGICIKKRFGLKQVADTGQQAKGDGLYWFESLQAFIVVINARVYTMDASYSLTDITGSDLLIEGAPCSFSEKVYAGRTYLFICNGGKLVYTDDLGSATQQVSGITFGVGNIRNLNNFMIINQVDTNFVYYNSGDPRSWNATLNFQATSNADKVSALRVIGDRLYIWGNRSVEVWAINVSGIIPIAKQRETGVTEGVVSPDSIVEQTGLQQIFMDEHRRVKAFVSGKSVMLSEDYNAELEKINYAGDAYAYFVELDGKRFYVVNFEVSNRSLMYDIDLNVWSELSYFNEKTGEYTRFRGGVYAYSGVFKKHVVLDYTNGLIYELDTEYKTDAGSPIVASVTTGNINHGTLSWKKSKNLTAIIERDISQNQEHRIQIQHRDNGSNKYSQLKNVPLSNTNAYGDNSVRLITRGGRWQTRQYRIVMPDPTTCVISNISEEVELERQ